MISLSYKNHKIILKILLGYVVKRKVFEGIAELHCKKDELSTGALCQLVKLHYLIKYIFPII